MPRIAPSSVRLLSSSTLLQKAVKSSRSSSFSFHCMGDVSGSTRQQDSRFSSEPVTSDGRRCLYWLMACTSSRRLRLPASSLMMDLIRRSSRESMAGSVWSMYCLSRVPWSSPMARSNSRRNRLRRVLSSTSPSTLPPAFVTSAMRSMVHLPSSTADWLPNISVRTVLSALSAISLVRPSWLRKSSRYVTRSSVSGPLRRTSCACDL
mmetsp:Transcript_2236/g.3711  ORF Transcript_2236/g.3711 Transcript_2236/m.3711 type:complete len:207 (-) Transcript_2236:2433-3053(-)